MNVSERKMSNMRRIEKGHKPFKTFHNECKGRGYICRRIHAGIQLKFKDIYGETIYAGVIGVKFS